jgi:6-phosphogluconolactonase
VVKDTISGNTETIAAGATSFTITPAVNSGASYNVTVTAQPAGPTESCSVTSGGTGIATANVTNIVVTCAISTFTVGGTITGYTGSGLVLTDSVSGHTKTVPASATSFTLTPAVNSGTTYNVTVTTQPTGPAQFCRVAGGAGSVTGAPVTSIVVSCLNTGKFVFVSNTFDDLAGGTEPRGSLSAFTITPATGALTAVTGSDPLSVMNTEPVGIAVDKSGLDIYVADSYSANVSTYSVNPSTGGLAFVSSATAGTDTATVTLPHTVALNPAGTVAYVGSFDTPEGNITSYSVSSGTLTEVVTAPAPPYTSPSSLGLVVDPNDHLVFATNSFSGTLSVFTVSGGTLTAVSGSPSAYQGGVSGTNGPYAIAAYPTGGFVYITDFYQNTVTAYSYTAAGVLTEVGTPLAVGTQPESVAVDPTGRFLYVANTGNGTVAGSVTACSINASTGALTLIGTIATAGTGLTSSTIAVQVDPSGQFVYTANGDDATVSAFKINQATGALTAIGTPLATGSGSQGIAVE